MDKGIVLDKVQTKSIPSTMAMDGRFWLRIATLRTEYTLSAKNFLR